MESVIQQQLNGQPAEEVTTPTLFDQHYLIWDQVKNAIHTSIP